MTNLRNRKQEIRKSIRTSRIVAAVGLWLLMAITACTRSADAHPGDCSAPLEVGSVANATQCLFILSVAVGISSCPTPTCACDPNGDSTTTATDALQCMNVAVGFPVELLCPDPCGAPPPPPPPLPQCDEIELTVRSGSDLDSGWKGPGHNADIIEGASVSFAILNRCSDDEEPCEIDADCTGGTCVATCDCNGTDRECEISGPTGAAACLGDTSIACAADSECESAGGLCVPFFGPPLPLAASGTPVCVTTYFSEPFSGTVDIGAGTVSANASLRSRVHLGINIATPCPSCGGRDTTAGEADTCIGGPRHGEACLVEAVSPQFGGVSSDCPPDRTANVSGVGLNVRFNEFTTAEASVSAVQRCGFPFDGIHPDPETGSLCMNDQSPCLTNDDCSGATCGLYCHCGFCDDGGGAGPDPDQPCFGDEDCPSGSRCRSEPGASNLSQAQPNGCASLVCGEVSPEECCLAGEEGCTTPTGFDGECNVNPTTCSTDQQCVVGGNGDECVRVPRACFENTITRAGSASPFGSYCVDDPEVGSCLSNSDCAVGPCAQGTSEPVTVALFCIPATASSGINSAAGLPGPASVSLNSVVRLCACGDGIVGCSEQCDDGNGQDGDGCDRNCRLEP